ncbi:DMT family transporter [Parafrankia discariae]|uniref:DMT family transporter n=1 Tax=Parafrankia discariae TaxID=365528 RepID=UPI00037B887C|nr:DMT family transporter [Parafrankia discariae]
MVTTYLLGLVSAVCFGVSAVIQQRVAFHAPPENVLRLRLLLWLVRRPLWDVGVCLSAIGTFASAAALARSTIAFVAPLQVCQLLFALPLAAVWARRRVPRRDWAAATATALGLATFLLAGAPHQGDVDAATTVGWILTGASVGGLAAWAVFGTRRLDPARRATLLAGGAGLLSALQGALVGGVGRLVENSGLDALPTSWQTYAVVVVALTSGLLLQSAYEMAPLPASLPAAVSMEPLAGVAIGVFLLGGMLRVGPLAVAGQIFGLMIMIFGVRTLATSPLVTGQLSRLRARQSQGQLSRLEDLLHRDLETLRTDLSRGRRASTDRAQRRQCRRLHNDLDRIHCELAKLVDDRDRLDARIHSLRTAGAKAAALSARAQAAAGESLASRSLAGPDPTGGNPTGKNGKKTTGRGSTGKKTAGRSPAGKKSIGKSHSGLAGQAGHATAGRPEAGPPRGTAPRPRRAPGIESRPRRAAATHPYREGRPLARAASSGGAQGQPGGAPGAGTTPGPGTGPSAGGTGVGGARAGGAADVLTDHELTESQRALDARADALLSQAEQLSLRADTVLRAMVH